MSDKPAEQEPVTIVDNRRIDPDTGDIRDAAQPEAAAPQPGSVEPGEVAEAVDAAGDVASTDTDTAAAKIATELAERTSDLQRLTAEYANYRRRVDRDRKAVVDNAKAAVIADLLVVLDDLDRARAHGDLESGPLKAVADKLVTAFDKHGLVAFGDAGESFDPALHEAVQHEGEGHDPVVGTVLRKGYKLGERVLRHALVGVTDGVADLASDPENATPPVESEQ